MGRAKVTARGGKKDKDPNKPKRSTSAYFYFLAQCREDAKKEGRSISKIAEFTKEASEQWRGLNGRDKKVFDDKAATDKARYEREMASYSGAPKVKDPNCPKKPLTGYFLFLADFRVKHKGSNIQNKDLLKLAGEQWRELDDSEKLPFEQRSQGEQKKYEAAMAEYRRTGSAAPPKSANGGAQAIEDDDDEEDYDDEEDDE